MQVGDLVRHKFGTLEGAGIVLSLRESGQTTARIVWAAHGQAKVFNMATLFLEVISENR